MTAEKYERNLLELRRVQGECDRYRQDCETAKEEVDRFAARIGKYQDHQERTKEEQDKLSIEAERYKDRLARAMADVEILQSGREKVFQLNLKDFRGFF